MIPLNPELIDVTSGTRHLIGQFQFPDNISNSDSLTDYEIGGIALQDPSRGLKYQAWKGYWNPVDSTAYLQPLDESAPPVSIFTETGDIEDFSFTFDQNMRWAAVTRKSDDTVQFRWYDSVPEAYVTTTYTGITSVKLALDDHRSFQVQGGVSDIILTYISSNLVCWRIQRDRFLTQYVHPNLVLAANMQITHFGLSNKLRLQWRMSPRRIQT